MCQRGRLDGIFSPNPSMPASPEMASDGASIIQSEIVSLHVVAHMVATVARPNAVEVGNA